MKPQLEDLPDEVLHHIGSFIIARDETLLQSYFGEFVRGGGASFTCSKNRLFLNATQFYLGVLGALNKNMYDRVRSHQGFFWMNNLFVWNATKQMDASCKSHAKFDEIVRNYWLYEKPSEDDESEDIDEEDFDSEEENDEEEFNYKDFHETRVSLHSEEDKNAIERTDLISNFLLLNSQCQFRKIFIQGHATFFNSLFTHTTQRILERELSTKISSQPSPAITPILFPFQFLHELYLHTNDINLFSLFDMIVKSTCPSLKRLHVMARKFAKFQETGASHHPHDSPHGAHMTYLPLTSLRILCHTYSFKQPNVKTQSTTLSQALGLYLPHFPMLQEIFLPFWTPDILQLVATSCFHIKDLVLHGGTLMNGSYDEVLELICQNIIALERFIIWRSALSGFYVDIGQAFFTRIFDHFHHTLREFSVATSLSRFSSLNDTDAHFACKLRMPSQLRTLIIENLEDHYYNSGTPLGVMNLLANIFSNNDTCSQNNLENIFISLRHYRLSNLDLITNNVKCLHLNIENTMEVITKLSQRPHASLIRDLYIQIHCNDDLEKLMTALKTKFFSGLRRLKLSVEPTSYGEQIDLFKLMQQVAHLEALELVNEHQVAYSQKFSPFYENEISLINVYRAVPTSDWMWNTWSGQDIHSQIPQHSSITNLKEFSIFTSSKMLQAAIPRLPNLTRLCIEVVNIESFGCSTCDMVSTISCTLHDLRYFKIGFLGTSQSFSKRGQQYPISIMANIEQSRVDLRDMNSVDAIRIIILFYIVTFRGLFSFSSFTNDGFVVAFGHKPKKSEIATLLELEFDKAVDNCSFEEKSDPILMANMKKAFIEEMIEKAVEK
ncbi:hypothetical protein FDP41_003007 [Naegleria fowleri]|uniref:Uncharacterized protein n=1 Tax=Naegleria fowleri TaxID=5763 RepID=A0A6A5BWK0_NAEFO|nr:uncharacterized protein FDP41_003007 [Naegleria fowleri]KAF0977685.1 hypothetical protein FDP41_003007 [Naegleria fowleri]